MRYFLSCVATLLFGMTAFAADATSLTDTAWQLDTYDGQTATGTLSFTQDTMYSRFCNNVSQKYTYNGTTLLSSGYGISTMMYCEGLPMTLENDFQLTTAAETTLASDILTITTSAKHIFVFKKVLAITSVDQLPAECVNALDECSNVCHRGDNGLWACTKMACETKVAPECTQTTDEPRMCTMEYMPVCGVDGVTYGNACSAGNVTIAYTGECTLIVGGDSDEYGCKASAGYIWDAVYGQCIRPWEKKIVFDFAVIHQITSTTTIEKFRPADLVTRQEAAALFVKTAKNLYSKTVSTQQDTCQKAYKDSHMIAPGFASIVQEACYLGLMVGNKGYFSPQGTLTRGQAFAILLKMTDVPNVFRPIERPNDAITRGELIELIQAMN